MICATCLNTMFVLSQTAIVFFSEIPVNIWVASFVVYAFHGSTILQSGVFVWVNMYTPKFNVLACYDKGTITI